MADLEVVVIKGAALALVAISALRFLVNEVGHLVGDFRRKIWRR
jgi:hypothetical protein